MSVDVEDWFQVENLRGSFPRETWKSQTLRVERNMDRMLELMAEHGVSCTCFVLGWVAERRPSLVARIAAEGHEVASHGYGHDLVTGLSPAEFRADVERSKEILEDAAGVRVRGYRAPNFSITDWSIAILQDVGFTYDSSSFSTIIHDRYGKLTGMTADAPVVELRPGFHEISVSCLNAGVRGLPWGGGAYFRLMPYPVFSWGVRRILRSARPYVFYIHPWEIDPGQPRVANLVASSRFRHYVGLRRAENRLESLVADFRWSTVSEVLDATVAGLPAAEASGIDLLATPEPARV